MSPDNFYDIDVGENNAPCGIVASSEIMTVGGTYKLLLLFSKFPYEILEA